MILHPYYRTQRSRLDQFDFVRLAQIPMLLLKVGVDIPSVPLLRLIHECLQQVSASRVLWSSGVGFRGRQSVSSAALIEQASHAASLPVNLHADELVLHRVGRRLQHGVYWSRGCGRM